MEDVRELSVREVEYLLTVFRKCREKGYTRNKHVVEELKVSKSTASLMIKKLSDMGLVVSTGRRLRLTDKGEKVIAEKLWKHGVLENALYSLGTSLKDSCRISWKIENVFSTEVVEEIWENLGRPYECPCGLKLPDRSSSKRLKEYPVCSI
ncbi:MAG: metal-dependent transcriptional regulator [Aigarchaeota archaeon]|nr:metal-dependent transcriptional regulator [Aigarchaeota archaeon]MCX8193244.1 metal-dependent transcriptional regulator [Nitrososphaeria archaeon]MDW7986384.1 metal-dependent transcriptional regulator [Nitrososphaerota archaeon]